jgi:outer membrane lipoprotein-sorting protein
MVLLGLFGAATAAAAPPAPDDRMDTPDAGELARRADAALRGETTTRAVRMTVVASRVGAPRVVAFHSWEDRRHGRAFIRVLSPAKSEGTTYLRLPPNVWSYAPRTERTRLVAPEALLSPWLGSDFTLDDWLAASSDVEDYEQTLLRTEEDADGREGVRAYVLEHRPRTDAAVTWGRIEAWIEVESGLPLRRDYFDREGSRVRTLRFHDFAEQDGRRFPQRWVMSSAGAPGRETRIEFESIVFDAEIDEAIFNTRNLKPPAAE